MGVEVITGTKPRKPKPHRALVLIPTTMAALNYCLDGFPRDLETILDTGLSVACLARSMCMSRATVSRWRSGRHEPREPMTMFAIRLWAEEIRNQEEVNDNAQRERN